VDCDHGELNLERLVCSFGGSVIALVAASDGDTVASSNGGTFTASVLVQGGAPSTVFAGKEQGQCLCSLFDFEGARHICIIDGWSCGPS